MDLSLREIGGFRGELEAHSISVFFLYVGRSLHGRFINVYRNEKRK